MHIDVVQHVQNRPHWFSIGFLKCGCARLYVRGVSRISIERLYKACCPAMWFNLDAFGSARHVSILHTRPVGHRYTCYHAIWSQNRCAVTASVQLRCAHLRNVVQNRPHWFSIGFLKCGCARLYVRGVSRISIERLYKACCHAMWFNLNALGRVHRSI